MYNAGLTKDVRKAEKAAAIAERDRVDFIRAAMSTTQGRAWFYEIIATCHVFAGDYTFDPIREAYKAGERNLGLKLFAELQRYCPDQYLQMMREANGPANPTELAGRTDSRRDVDRPSDAADSLDDPDPDSDGALD